MNQEASVLKASYVRCRAVFPKICFSEKISFCGEPFKIWKVIFPYYFQSNLELIEDMEDIFFQHASIPAIPSRHEGFVRGVLKSFFYIPFMSLYSHSTVKVSCQIEETSKSHRL